MTSSACSPGETKATSVPPTLPPPPTKAAIVQPTAVADEPTELPPPTDMPSATETPTEAPPVPTEEPTPWITSEANLDDTQVTYVGNSGFLITVGDRKVLIDGIFYGFSGTYKLPLNVQDSLVNASPPFDDIDLILATHSHGDHFSAGMVQTHMQNDPKTVLISTSQVTNQMEGFGDRVITLDASAGNPVQKDINGIQVEAIYLSHGKVTTGETEIMNQGYIIKIDGVTLFHTGDIDARLLTPGNLTGYDFPGKNIDIAFIQHFFLSDAAFQSLINGIFKSKYVVASHYKFTDPINTEMIVSYYPDAVIFTEEMQNWVGLK